MTVLLIPSLVFERLKVTASLDCSLNLGGSSVTKQEEEEKPLAH